MNGCRRVEGIDNLNVSCREDHEGMTHCRLLIVRTKIYQVPTQRSLLHGCLGEEESI
jgi:hypothetical protein